MIRTRTSTATTAKAAPIDEPAAINGRTGRPTRTACIIAGLGLVLMAALAGFGYFVAVDGLVTAGDATATAADIRASSDLFRLGILSLFGVAALDIVVAWALYRIFVPVRRTLSAVAATLRYVYAGVFTIAVMQLAAALRLLDPANVSEAAVPDALARIEAFNTIWDAGLILFGLHLIIIAYLAYRSRFLPRFLGLLLAAAAIGYVFDSSAALTMTAPPPEISTVTFIGEFLLALWLLFGSRRISSNPCGSCDLQSSP